MKKEKMKYVLITAVLSIFAISAASYAIFSSSEVRISTKSPAAFQETANKLLSSLPPSEQDHFREAFIILVRAKSSSEKEIESIITSPPSYLDGKSASDIIGEGRKIASACAETGDCPGVLLESKYQ